MRSRPSTSSIVVGVDHEREHRPVDAGGGLDHVRDVALLGLLVEVLELLAGVPRRAPGGRSRRGWRSPRAPKSPSESGIRCPRSRSSNARARRRRGRAGSGCRAGCRARCTSASRSAIQCSCQRSASSGGQKNSISICSNSRVRKMKLPGGDLVAKRLADLGDPERRLLARELQDVLEVDEDPLSGLRAQVGDRARVLHRADGGLEHQVELARLGELAVRALAGALRRLAAALRRPRACRRGSAACRSCSRPSGR